MTQEEEIITVTHAAKASIHKLILTNVQIAQLELMPQEKDQLNVLVARQGLILVHQVNHIALHAAKVHIQKQKPRDVLLVLKGHMLIRKDLPRVKNVHLGKHLEKEHHIVINYI